ncbi:hypothetical protein E3N88_27009 [Mikania micrantha]|uniref:Uncharacterized protein n=1 Tax=Mikania micrantha TaxID=192012 RepID=A0A5N6MVM0_9ASTR|nr:hypothetical protein E3N88_27009 [Mikania micrantha]
MASDQMFSISLNKQQQLEAGKKRSVWFQLTLEKEELIQALSTESSLSSKLKDLNNELTHKLEVKAQRLELLTSQSMMSDIPPRKAGPRTMVDHTPYADEGCGKSSRMDNAAVHQGGKLTIYESKQP